MSETAKTYINVAIMLAVAIVLGCLFGGSIQYFLGADDSSVSATIFNDRMSVVKQVFTEQNVEYQQLCQSLVSSGEDDLRIIKKANGEISIRRSDGSVVGLDYLDGDSFEAASLVEGETPPVNSLLVTELFSDDIEVLKTAVDYAGDPITDVALSMIYLKDGQITWYMYSSQYGYIALLYGPKKEIQSRMDVIALSVDEQYEDAWGIVYSFED